MTERHPVIQFVADLRERKVVRSALAYLLIAWLIVQAADVILPAFEAPRWVQRALITFLLLGLPLVVFLEWLYDLTPSGFVRTPEAQRGRRRPPFVRWAAAASATALTGLAVWWTWHGYFAAEVEPPRLTRPAPRLEAVIAVAPLRNLTGDPAIDWLGAGVANLVRDALAESRRLVVVSPTRWEALRRSASQPGDELRAAAAARIDYVLSGEIMRAPEGLLIAVRISDIVNGIELNSDRIDRLTPQTLLGQADRLVLLTKRALNVPHTERVASFAADVSVDSVAAYESYLAGLGYFLRFDYRQAERALRSALELADDFHMARYRLAHVQAATGRTESALRTLAEIPRDAPLTPRERAYIEGAKALFARDAERAKGIYRRLLEEVPYDVEAQLLLAMAHDVAYEDRAALERLEKLLGQEPENDIVWSYLGETHLRLGQFEAAREALDRYLELEPDDPYGFTVLGQLDQLQGRYDAAAGHFARALALESGFERARLGLARTDALRGRWSAAEEGLWQLVRDPAATATIRIDAAFDLGSVLLAGGRVAESVRPLQHVEQLVEEEQVREAMALAVRGLAAARQGDVATAERLVARAIAASPGVPTRYLFARGQLALLRDDVRRARATAAEIRRHALPPEDPDRTEERAALYLEGMAALRSGAPQDAVARLGRAVSLEGHQYALYRLGLAQAALAAGDREQALLHARAAAVEREGADIRLDLEPERLRARLLEAQILAASGDASRAAALARPILVRLQGAPPAHPERRLAAQLANAVARR